MACLNRQFARIVTSKGLTLLVLVLLLAAFQVSAQTVPPRPHGGPDRGDQPEPAASAQPAPAKPALAQPAPVSEPQSASPVSPVAPSLLQQPAGEAQILFSGDTLSIRADNSSLSAILQQVAGKSGMQIEGLSGDERVFGTFGPGAPRDVLADLLNGTAYNVVLLGDLSNGAPRQLILTPTTHGGVAPPPPARTTTTDEAANEPEAAEVPPPQQPEVAPAGSTPPPTPGVKTPQQLFEQLQRMRQQQQTTTTPDAQQQQQPPQ
jgi:hypothetical protein